MLTNVKTLQNQA